MKIKKISGKSFIVMITAVIVLTTLVAGLFSLPNIVMRKKHAPHEELALTEVPQIITSDTVAPTDNDRLLVTNSPADGLKINSNKKYIPEKNEALKAADEELILFVRYSDEQSVRNSLYNLGLSLVRLLQSDGTVIATNPNNIPSETINKLAAKDENILFIMDNCIRMKKTVTPTVENTTPPYVPNDPYYSDMWHLSDTSGVSISKAWETTKGSSDVLVAVIDSGIVTNHEEFKGKIVKQYDIPDNDGDASDTEDFSHGSHVAGIIAANADNNIGICGIASGVSLLIIDTFYYDEYEGGEVAEDADIFTAYDLCISEGADVVNMSFGGFVSDMDIRSHLIYDRKLSNMRNNNIVSVAAAGNESVSDDVYPADADAVISVIATDKNNKKCDFSNYGFAKDISAPGEKILSIANATEYTYANGTSMAAPVVTGVIALLLSRKKDLTPKEVEEIIYSTATRLGSATSKNKDVNFGYGKINAAAAMELLNTTYEFDTVTATPSSTPSITPSTTVSSDVEQNQNTSTVTPNIMYTPSVENTNLPTLATTTQTPAVTTTSNPTAIATSIATPIPTSLIEPTEDPIIKKSIKFKKKKVKIKLGKKKVLKVKITGAKKAKFSVNKKGRKIVKLLKRKPRKVTVKAKKKGKTVIRAKAAGKKAKCRVIVK